MAQKKLYDIGIDALEKLEIFVTPGFFFSTMGFLEFELAGYDLFMRLKSSLVIRPSGGGVKLFEPLLGEFEAELGSLLKFEGRFWVKGEGRAEDGLLMLEFGRWGRPELVFPLTLREDGFRVSGIEDKDSPAGKCIFNF